MRFFVISVCFALCSSVVFGFGVPARCTWPAPCDADLLAQGCFPQLGQCACPFGADVCRCHVGDGWCPTSHPLCGGDCYECHTGRAVSGCASGETCLELCPGQINLGSCYEIEVPGIPPEQCPDDENTCDFPCDGFSPVALSAEELESWGLTTRSVLLLEDDRVLAVFVVGRVGGFGHPSLSWVRSPRWEGDPDDAREARVAAALYRAGVCEISAPASSPFWTAGDLSRILTTCGGAVEYADVVAAIEGIPGLRAVKMAREDLGWFRLRSGVLP